MTLTSSKFPNLMKPDMKIKKKKKVKKLPIHYDTKRP